MNEMPPWFDPVTAWIWLIAAGLGILVRCRRLWRLHRIDLGPRPDPSDVAYLASEKRAGWLRLGVKCVLLTGAIVAVFDQTALWPLWRIGLDVALVLLAAETLGVDHTRGRLGRASR